MYGKSTVKYHLGNDPKGSQLLQKSKEYIGIKAEEKLCSNMEQCIIEHTVSLPTHLLVLIPMEFCTFVEFCKCWLFRLLGCQLGCCWPGQHAKTSLFRDSSCLMM